MGNAPASLAASADGIHIEPFAVTKREAMRLVGMPKLVQRWLFHGWVIVVRQGGRGCETMIDFESLENAYNRLKKGEQPPLLPSEIKSKSKTKPMTGTLHLVQ